MGSEGPKTVTIHVTGFKKFQGVSENPTETIVNNLSKYIAKRGPPAGVILGSCIVLETAGEGARPGLYKTFEAAATNENSGSVVWVSRMNPASYCFYISLAMHALSRVPFTCQARGHKSNLGMLS